MDRVGWGVVGGGGRHVEGGAGAWDSGQTVGRNHARGQGGRGKGGQAVLITKVLAMLKNTLSSQAWKLSQQQVPATPGSQLLSRQAQAACISA